MARAAAVLVALLALAAVAIAEQRPHVRTGGAASRRLMQGGSCPGQIPRCTAGRCTVQTIGGRAQSVCERCLASYVPSKNGLNCICPPGTYEVCSGGSCSCQACEKAFFCTGGNPTAKNGAPASDLGVRLSCNKARTVTATVTTAMVQGTGITTKSTKSKRFTDCVPMPGYFLLSLSKMQQAADACPPNSYSPGYGRIRSCFPCQSGSQENPAIGLTVRSDKLQVCQVPPGRYVSQNVIRLCPPGMFRTSFARADEVAATRCLPCPPGITTNSTASTGATACSVVEAGVAYNAADLASAQAAAASDSTSLLTPPPKCPYGFYCPGGSFSPGGALAGKTNSAFRCPFGTTTQDEGAESVSDCMVPPGYYIKLSAAAASTGSMQKCPTDVGGNGFFRSGWVSYQEPSVREAGDGSTTCTPCGAAIKSDYTDVDESNGGTDAAARVAASPASCYIEAGWGIVPTGGVATGGILQYKATLCDYNSYGVANRTYGLVSAACKPCARNLITLQQGSTSYTDCISPGGYGYGPGGASPCQPGYYAPQGSNAGCVMCPFGRTTAINASLQLSITDCVVLPGYGVYDPSSSDPWSPATPSPLAAAQLSVLLCPMGSYSPGGAVDTKCVGCVAGSTTITEGTAADSSATGCTKCTAGYGKQSGSSLCTVCPIGTYQQGYVGLDSPGYGDGETCVECVPTMYVYQSSQGEEEAINSTGTTLRQGAYRREECVPRFAQIGIDIGQRIILDDALLTPLPGITLRQCLDQCAPIASAGAACIAQYDYGHYVGGAAICRTASLAANADGVLSGCTPGLLYVKMIPSDALGATSTRDGDVNTKAMSSGMYARLDVPCTWPLASVGTELPGLSWPLGGSVDLSFVKTQCDMSSRCWGFTVNAAGVATLRGGQDAQDLRSFYYNPGSPDGGLVVVDPEGAPVIDPSLVPSPSPLPASPSPSPAPAAIPSPSPAPAAIPSPSPAPAATPSPSPAPAAIPSPSPAPAAIPSPSPAPAAVPSPSPAPAAIPSPSPAPAAIPSPSPAPRSPSPAPAAIPSPSPSPAPAAIPSPSPAPAAIPSPSPSPAPAAIPSPSPAPAAIPSPSPAPAAIPSPSPAPRSPSPAPAAIPSPSPSPAPAAIPSPSPAPAAIPSPSPAPAAIPSPSPAPRSPSPAPAAIPSPSPAPAAIPSPSPAPRSPSPAPAAIPSPSPAPAAIPSPSPAPAVASPSPAPPASPSPAPLQPGDSVCTSRPINSTFNIVTMSCPTTQSGQGSWEKRPAGNSYAEPPGCIPSGGGCKSAGGQFWSNSVDMVEVGVNGATYCACPGAQTLGHIPKRVDANGNPDPRGKLICAPGAVFLPNNASQPQGAGIWMVDQDTTTVTCSSGRQCFDMCFFCDGKPRYLATTPGAMRNGTRRFRSILGSSCTNTTCGLSALANSTMTFAQACNAMAGGSSPANLTALPLLNGMWWYRPDWNNNNQTALKIAEALPSGYVINRGQAILQYWSASL